MATTTTVYVVTVTQGQDECETRVVTAFLTQGAARKFISRLEYIVDGERDDCCGSKFENWSRYRRLLNKLISIHPQSTIPKIGGHPKYNMEECELMIENPNTLKSIHVVTVLQGDDDIGMSQVVTAFPTEDEALDFIKQLNDSELDSDISFQDTMKYIAAIHPRAIVDNPEEDDFPSYDYVNVDLNPGYIGPAATSTIHVVTAKLVDDDCDTRIVKAFRTEKAARKFIASSCGSDLEYDFEKCELD